METENRQTASIADRISRLQADLTPKSRILGTYVVENPRKVVFMTVAELARACGVSEATVVRFVIHLGYEGYADFQHALRDFVDTELTLLDRLDLTDMLQPGGERFRRVVFEEIDNLRQLYERLDVQQAARVVSLLKESPEIYVVGSRLSYAPAYYLGWSLTKVRSGIRIFAGSDNTVIDWLTIAPGTILVVMFAMTRYPNELLRLAKLVKRLGLQLVVITDSTTCPMLHYADESLVAPSTHIPLIGSPTTLSCLINYLVQDLASRYDHGLKQHQERLEQSYRENDVLFHSTRVPPDAR